MAPVETRGRRPGQGDISTGVPAVDSHGVVETPVFMPVGTRATVKGILPISFRGSAYRSYWPTPTTSSCVREQISSSAGGLHRFMNWDRAILTDSGGFQIFSLAETLKVSERASSSAPSSTGLATSGLPKTTCEYKSSSALTSS
jgi:queuine tRNA-ribosyltransferase